MGKERLINLLDPTQETDIPKLTKRFVEALIPDVEKTLTIWDTELKGFGVVLLPSGRLTYCLKYRNAERIQKRLKIGIHGQITAEEARTLARKYLSMITQGEDPAEEKRSVKHSPDIRELGRDYVERYGKNKRPRSLIEDQKANFCRPPHLLAILQNKGLNAFFKKTFTERVFPSIFRHLKPHSLFQ